MPVKGSLVLRPPRPMGETVWNSYFKFFVQVSNGLSNQKGRWQKWLVSNECLTIGPRI